MSAWTRRLVMKVRNKRGTTLVELMACLVFLAVAVYPMLSCISGAAGRAMNASERMVVLGMVEDQIETERGLALQGSLAASSATTTQNPSSVYTPVSLTTSVSLVSGYTDLYSITVTGTWGSPTLPNRNGTISITSYMRSSHV